MLPLSPSRWSMWSWFFTRCQSLVPLSRSGVIMGVRERRLSGLLAVRSMLSASTEGRGMLVRCPSPPCHQPLRSPSLHYGFRAHHGHETGALGSSLCSHHGLGALLGPSSQPAGLCSSLAEVQEPQPSWKGFCRGLSCSQHCRCQDCRCLLCQSELTTLFPSKPRLKYACQHIRWSPQLCLFKCKVPLC